MTDECPGNRWNHPGRGRQTVCTDHPKACAFDPAKRYQTPEEFYRDLDDLKHGRMTGRAQKTSEIKQKDRSSSDIFRRDGAEIQESGI